MRSLETIYIPNKIKSIAFESFALSGLKNFIHNNKIVTMYTKVFNNTCLTSIELLTIGNQAFQNSKLAFIVIPDSVISIRDGAFEKINLNSSSVIKLPEIFDNPTEHKRIGLTI